MPRQIANDHDDKRDAILSLATRVFATQGFDRASMALVAQTCSVSKAALYHYFPSKNAILFAILDRHLRGLRDHVTTLETEGRTTEDHLAFMIEEILVYYRGKDDVHELQMFALGQLEAEDQSHLKSYMRAIVGHLSKQIAAVDPKQFQDRGTLRMAAMSIFGMLNWYFTWNRGRGVDARRTYARYVAQIFLHGAYHQGHKNKANPSNLKRHEPTVLKR